MSQEGWSEPNPSGCGREWLIVPLVDPLHFYGLRRDVVRISNIETVLTGRQVVVIPARGRRDLNLNVRRFAANLRADADRRGDSKQDYSRQQ